MEDEEVKKALIEGCVKAKKRLTGHKVRLHQKQE